MSSRLRNLLEVLPAAAYTCDADGLISYCNERAIELWGRTPKLNDPADRFCGSFRLFDLHGAPIRHDECWMALALRANRPYTGCEFVVERPDGQRLTVLADAKPLRDGQGRLVGAVSVLVDLSHRRRFEHGLREANRAKDQVLAMVAHELCTPLSAMRGWLDLLQAKALPPAERPSALERIDRALMRQERLIRDLLDQERVLAGKLEVLPALVDLSEVVAREIEEWRPSAEQSGLALRYEGPAAPLVVNGDGVRLAQIAANLLSNAIRYTPTGGEVQVRVEARGSQAAIVVSDTGEGMTPEVIERMFERFWRADYSRSGGLGLGLSIVKHLVDEHRGTIRAESPGPGLGSTFTVELPLLGTSPLILAAPAPQSQREVRLEGIRVLCVDDSEDARDALAILLQMAGATVVTASSSRTALAAYDQERPSVVVTDISMKGEDGYALLEEIRRRDARQRVRTPVIAATGFAGVEDRRAALRAGFDEHIGKPIDHRALEALIRTVVRDSAAE